MLLELIKFVNEKSAFITFNKTNYLEEKTEGLGGYHPNAIVFGEKIFLMANAHHKNCAVILLNNVIFFTEKYLL